MKDLSHIDFENGIIHGKLKQIRQSEKQERPIPLLLPVWVCRISPSQSRQVLSFIKDVINPIDPFTFLHVKRLKKIVGPEVKLDVIICSKKLCDTEHEVLSLLSDNGISEIGISSIEIPSNSPNTRDMALEWSEKYWPIAWKGNPNLQFLKQTSFDLDHEISMINKLIDVWNTKNVPAAIFKNNEVEISSFDKRDQHPLYHSIMVGIQAVADYEKQKRFINHQDITTNYLLNNFTVYTTHEPCVMCCMALVHSRIERLIYLKPNNNGGLESNYQLGDRDGLNWKFEIWKWLDDFDLEGFDGVNI